MTKLLVLCLVLSALVTVTESDSDVIVNDGYRVIVVEYDVDGRTNTRVLISPPEKIEKEEKRGDEGEVLGNKKKETASFLREDQDREHNTSSAKEKANIWAEKKAHKAQNVWEKAKMGARGIGTTVGAALRLTKIGSVVGLVGIAAAYGMCVWVTFVSEYVLTSVLGRQQGNVVQSKVYLVYVKAVSVGILAGLLGHVISRRRKVLTDAVEMWQAVNLMSSILMVEANASFVEPRAIKVMLEQLKAEKEDGRGLDPSELQSSEAAARTGGRENTVDDELKQRLTKLRERMCRLNAYSSRLNLLTFMSLTWYFVYLGHLLDLTC